jgi:two-component system chemotaxis sensor kinase CheA
LVRNAIDHGIEKPEIRRAQGKPAKGRISLHAKNESGSIVIEISDDGKGIDYQRVLDQAIKQGIYPEGYVLSEAEAQQLIFMAGFSTAEEITEISGRGVGMDVVKRQIEQLHGNIMIQSTQGRGTSIRMRLPMTLASISGFQVIVGDMVFVVPLDVAVECINLGHYAVSNHIVTLRGEPLTFIDMRALFDMPLREMERKNVLVVQYAGHRIGLLVDELQGECQAVVKPLSKLFVKMRGFSGSAVLGDGRIALILDVAHLVDYARQAEQDALIKSE